MAQPKHTPGTPIAPHVKERAAELVGLGLSYTESAGACGISEKSIERIMAVPEYRKLAEDTKKKRTSMASQVADVVKELLTAEDADGNALHHLRKMGAELYARAPQLLDAVEDEEDESILPGVILRFPNAKIPNEQAPVEFSPDELAPIPVEEEPEPDEEVPVAPADVQSEPV